MHLTRKQRISDKGADSSFDPVRKEKEDLPMGESGEGLSTGTERINAAAVLASNRKATLFGPALIDDLHFSTFC